MTTPNTSSDCTTTVTVWPLIQWHRDGSQWWADSPDVPRWTAAADTKEQLESLIEESKEFHFAPLGWPKQQERLVTGA